MVHESSSRNGRVARDKRAERDSRAVGDGRLFEVRSSGFPERRTQNFELRVAPVARFPPISLESGIRAQQKRHE